MITRISIVFLFLHFLFNSISQSCDSIKLSDSILSDSIRKTETPIDSLWFYLTRKKNGCLTGGQYVKNNRFGNETCIMTMRNTIKSDTSWEMFFLYDKVILTSSLIEQLADTIETRIHACPWMLARTGELAVYALQNISKKNWYELPDFEQYSKRTVSGCTNGPQTWLWAVLKNENQWKLMTDQWLKLISQN